MVPILANTLFTGSVKQHPRIAQARYGAPTTRPVRPSCMDFVKRGEVIPNSCQVSQRSRKILIHLHLSRRLVPRC